MESLWDQMRRGRVKMPADSVVFEGDHDLIYLYNVGFVDTDKYSQQTWLNAFRESRKANGAYHLTKKQWLDKTKYRYNELVVPPFNPLRLREGEWTVEDLKKLAKQKIIPETIITYEQYLKGLEEAKQKGLIKDGIMVVTREWKLKLLELLNQHPSPKRRRALMVEQLRRKEELEEPGSDVPQPTTTTTAETAPSEKTVYDQAPDQRKQLSGKLSDLLSGSKK